MESGSAFKSGWVDPSEKGQLKRGNWNFSRQLAYTSPRTTTKRNGTKGNCVNEVSVVVQELR